MKARTCRRTASSRGSNQSPPTNGDGDVAAADVASVMAWVPSRSCRSEPTPPQLFPTNLAPRPQLESQRVYQQWGAAKGYVPPPPDPAQVKDAQRMLTALAYYNGPADGLMGPATSAAIANFQRRQGQPVTGVFTPGLLNELRVCVGAYQRCVA